MKQTSTGRGVWPDKARHGNAFFIAALLPLQRRACWQRYADSQLFMDIERELDD